MSVGKVQIAASAILALLIVCKLHGEPTDRPSREQVGEVLGSPVYRDEIRPKGDLRSELGRLFLTPLMKKYREDHKAEIEPSETEIDAMAEFQLMQSWQSRAHRQQELKKTEQSLANPKLTETKRQELEKTKANLQTSLQDLPQSHREIAAHMLGSWKFQRHLYDHYGGGRILFQQFGLEAFDATKKWLEASEQQGNFKVTDPQLHDKLLEYWTTMRHGAFLSDSEEVRKGFLEPKWVLKKPSPPK